MRKTAVLIMIITLISKIFGLGRELTLAYFYGASNVSDAYLVSISVPSIIFGFVISGIAAGYIPMYNKITQNDGEIEANRFTNNLLNILLLSCTVIILLGLLFTDYIVKVIASGFEGETLAIAILFTKISLLAIYFIGIVSIFSGFLQIKGNFAIPALIGLPLNFFIVLSIIISHKTDIILLAIGFLIATASQVLLFIPYLRKNKYKYSLTLDFRDKNMINMAYIALPIIIGVSANQINLLVDRTIASQIAVGGISALNYANTLNLFVQGIVVLSITTVSYPTMAKMAVENNMLGFKNSLSESITGINLLVIPATVGFMVFSVPIVSMLFGRGVFDENAISMTSYALFFYSIGMFGFGLRQILSRAFFSIHDTKTPMINGAIGVVLNILLNVILSKYMGIGGLALATSISATVTAGLMLFSLRKKIGPFEIKHTMISFLKILFASLIMGLISKATFNFLTTSVFSQNLSLSLAISVGAISYFVIIYFMKIRDVDVIVNAIKKKLVKF